MRRNELAKMIDHTLLGPTASTAGVETLCAEAVRYGFYAVCVNPCHVKLAYSLVKDSPVKVAAVIGFPHGMTTADVKRFEAQEAIAAGASELDMVINVAALKEGDYETVLTDIRAVCTEARKAPTNAVVKVILETALLDDQEKIAGAVLAKAGGADFVKTSTGFGPGGATVDDVALLRRTVGEKMGVKAAGGIHDYDTAVKMIAAGATRIGASHSVDIITGAPE